MVGWSHSAICLGDPILSMAYLVFLIVVAGLIGGAINALLSDNGFLMPRPQSVGGGTIYRPGFLGNMLIGAVSSFVSLALYGPLANVVIAGPATSLKDGGDLVPGITLSSLGGAVLVGVAGSRWPCPHFGWPRHWLRG